VFYESKLMRGNQGVFWQDMGLQDSGYTWDYFAPQILEDPDIAFGEGQIAPGGPGYKALIIYQDALPLSSAKRILSWAKEGLPVILVNGATERTRPLVSKTHAKAAALTPFNGEKDADLAGVIAELKSLPTVKELDDQSKTVECLRSLGIVPRAGFEAANKNILSCLREDGDLRVLFVYNFKYTERSATTFTVVMEGAGKPRIANCWTGEIREAGCYVREKGITKIELALMPGEARLVLLDTAAPEERHAVALESPSGDSNSAVIIKDGKLALKAFSGGSYRVTFSDGATAAAVTVPGALRLDAWDLTVEDWNEGEKKTIVEDRGLGIVTNEVYFETKKTRIPVGKTRLIPWRNIPGVGPDVSGVGYYSAEFDLSPDWKAASDGACLVLGSTNGNSAAVYVNGTKGPAYDFNARTADISGLLVPGKNSITVEVSSTLNNRLKARNYPDIIKKMMEEMSKNFAKEGGDGDGGDAPPPLPAGVEPDVQDYGLTGDARLVFYKVQTL
jgi:hypothetical protein